MDERVEIKNRKDQKVIVLVDKIDNAKGLAFVMHGLGGFKEKTHIIAFKEAFKESGFTVVRFDTTCTLGESDGDYADATVTNYYQDLEDVIAWADSQEWYLEPFWICGHSLGGISVSLFAENFPEKVKGVAPISPVVSGKLSMETEKHKSIVEDWKKTGWRITESNSKPGTMKKLKWSHMEDRMKYDLLPKASNLTMPVLIIVGDKDEGTPARHQQILFDAIPSERKELHIIENAPHTFKDEEHLAEIKEITKKWIANNL